MVHPYLIKLVSVSGLIPIVAIIRILTKGQNYVRRVGLGLRWAGYTSERSYSGTRLGAHISAVSKPGYHQLLHCHSALGDLMLTVAIPRSFSAMQFCTASLVQCNHTLKAYYSSRIVVTCNVKPSCATFLSICLLHMRCFSTCTSVCILNLKCFQRVFQVLAHALSCLPLLLQSLDELGSPRCDKEQLMTMAKQVSAALASLGGFEELIKPGCAVQVRTAHTQLYFIAGQDSLSFTDLDSLSFADLDGVLLHKP